VFANILTEPNKQTKNITSFRKRHMVLKIAFLSKIYDLFYGCIFNWFSPWYSEASFIVNLRQLRHLSP